MRSGFVRLKPGETVGWHTTGKNEESLVILRGRGEARIEGEPARPFAAPALVYIPPRHGTTLRMSVISSWNMYTLSRRQRCSNEAPRLRKAPRCFRAGNSSRAGSTVPSVAAILLRRRGVQAKCVIVQVALGNLQCLRFRYFVGRHHFRQRGGKGGACRLYALPVGLLRA